MQFKNRLRVSKERDRGSHGSTASHREPTCASIRYYYNYYYYYNVFFLFCFFVLGEHVTGCRRKLPKRTSDGREKEKTGEEATFCILWGGSWGASAFPRHGAAGAPPHLLAGWGAQAPPGRWGNAVNPLSRWTHSGSPVTGAGL